MTYYTARFTANGQLMDVRKHPNRDFAQMQVRAVKGTEILNNPADIELAKKAVG